MQKRITKLEAKLCKWHTNDGIKMYVGGAILEMQKKRTEMGKERKRSGRNSIAGFLANILKVQAIFDSGRNQR